MERHKERLLLFLKLGCTFCQRFWKSRVRIGFYAKWWKYMFKNVILLFLPLQIFLWILKKKTVLFVIYVLFTQSASPRSQWSVFDCSELFLLPFILYFFFRVIKLMVNIFLNRWIILLRSSASSTSIKTPWLYPKCPDKICKGLGLFFPMINDKGFRERAVNCHCVLEFPGTLTINDEKSLFWWDGYGIEHWTSHTPHRQSTTDHDTDTKDTV